MSPGADAITAERERHQADLGFSPERDDQYVEGELNLAAACYLEAALQQIAGYPVCGLPDNWPWHECGWKPSPSPQRNLEKAGALIAAEHDRIERLKDWEQL